MSVPEGSLTALKVFTLCFRIFEGRNTPWVRRPSKRKGLGKRSLPRGTIELRFFAVLRGGGGFQQGESELPSTRKTRRKKSCFVNVSRGGWHQTSNRFSC